MAGAPELGAIWANFTARPKAIPCSWWKAFAPDRAIPPQTPRIHAVITARLAQLSPASYELAGMAGAIGRTFTLDLLAKSTDWDEDSLSRALDELWQRRIIEGHGERNTISPTTVCAKWRTRS